MFCDEPAVPALRPARPRAGRNVGNGYVHDCMAHSSSSSYLSSSSRAGGTSLPLALCGGGCAPACKPGVGRAGLACSWRVEKASSGERLCLSVHLSVHLFVSLMEALSALLGPGWQAVSRQSRQGEGGGARGGGGGGVFGCPDPFFVVDLECVLHKYRRWHSCFPRVKPFYGEQGLSSPCDEATWQGTGVVPTPARSLPPTQRHGAVGLVGRVQDQLRHLRAGGNDGGGSSSSSSSIPWWKKTEHVGGGARPRILGCIVKHESDDPSENDGGAWI